MMELKIKCSGEFKPKKGSEFAAGIDLYNNGDDVIVAANEVQTIHTGCYFEIPSGYVGLLFVRSSIGSKKLITLSNGTGVIDSDYRGEVIAKVIYSGETSSTIPRGERFAQLVIVPVLNYSVNFVDELESTERGTGGFGSSGKN